MIWTLSRDVLVPKNGITFEALGHTCKVVSVLNVDRDYTLAEVDLVNRKPEANPIRYRENRDSPSIEIPAPVEANVQV